VVLTDDKGNYRLFGVPPGEYFVHAQSTSSDRVTAYYPGVPFADAAIPILVSTFELAGIDFKLGIGARYSVSLKVAGLQELPPDFQFRLRPKGKLDSFGPGITLPAKENAVYRIPEVSPASYTLEIQSNPRDIQTVDVDILDKDIDLGTVAIQPKATITIEGRVTFAGGVPTTLNVILRPENLPSFASGQAAPDAQGETAFSIPRLSVGTYRVGTSFLPDRYLLAARYNGRDVLGSGLSVESNSAGKLELVIDGPPGSASGTVRDNRDEPASDAFVVLVPAPDRRGNADLYSTVMSDQLGRFSFAKITPGEYSLFAWESMQPNAYRNAEWLKEYELHAVRITVDKGSKVTSTLRVIPRPK
jgi:hypothetical protein